MSRIVTSAPTPAATRAALAPAIPPPSTATRPGRTPEAPLTNTPHPPFCASMHRLVGECRRAAAQQLTCKRRLGSQMEIGEEHEVAPQETKFGMLRLLDLE